MNVADTIQLKARWVCRKPARRARLLGRWLMELLSAGADRLGLHPHQVQLMDVEILEPAHGRRRHTTLAARIYWSRGLP